MKDSKSNLFATVAFAFTVARLHARLQSRETAATSLARSCAVRNVAQQTVVAPGHVVNELEQTS